MALFLPQSRPIGGYVNFCPISTEDITDEDSLFAVAKHEVIHALVRDSTHKSCFILTYHCICPSRHSPEGSFHSGGTGMGTHEQLGMQTDYLPLWMGKY